MGSCKETALYLAFFAERNALQQKDQNRDSRLKRYCYFSATSKPCLAQLVKLRTAFKSYSSAEAVRSRDFSKYTELSTAYGLYSSAGFEENAKIAFVNLPLNAYTGLVDILVIGKRAKEGDPEALLQLDLIVANFQQSVLHPIDSISTSIKGRLEEADQYEANGDINRAQQIRSSIFIEATLSVTGVFATSKMIFNFPEGRFGVGAEANTGTANKPNLSNDVEFSKQIEQSLPKKTWVKDSFDGRNVYKNSKIIDPAKVDVKGRTNVQRMEEGLSPVSYTHLTLPTTPYV